MFKVHGFYNNTPIRWENCKTCPVSQQGFIIPPKETTKRLKFNALKI